MKKHVLLIMSIFCFLTIRILGQSQVGNYNFQSSLIAYNEISGGLLLGSESNDDQRFVDPANLAGGTITTGPGFQIGFGFVFAGEEFDRVAINTNGWISLGKSSLTPSVNNSSSNAYLPIGSTTAITPPELVSRIVAIGRDLQGQTGATLRIQTVGVAPNRECVIQWKGYKKYGTAGTGDNYNFQIRLVETSNQVKLVYGLMINNATSTTVQVGLRAKPATEVTNYHNRETTSNWSSTTKGATPTASCTLSSSVYPANGLCYIFSPIQEVPDCAINVSPQVGAGNVPVFATLNWSPGGGGSPAGYKLYFGTDYPPTNIVNGTDLGNVTSYDPDPDLQYSMQYYWMIIPYNQYGEPVECDIWSFTAMDDPTIFSLPYSQGFEDETFPPLGWQNYKTEGPSFPGTWDRQINGTNPACSPQSGIAMARYNSYNYQNGTKGVLVTPSIKVGVKNCEVSFWMYRDPGFTNDPDLVNVHYNTTPDLVGATLLGTIHRDMNRDPIVLAQGWYQYSFSFQTVSGDNYLIFEGVSDYGNNMFIDDIEITSPVSVVINAGNDAYTVAEGSIGFGTDRGYPAIPSGFFGPGSDPFEGNIKLKGQASNGSQLPNPDMMVNRSFGVEFNAIPGEVVIGTEMLQLNLVSKDPIKVTKGGGMVESFFDVFFQIDIPQPGNMDISLEHETGGTFTMNFSVFPKITFRNTIDPSEEYVLDPLGMGYLPLEYNSQPYGWTTSPIPGDFDPLGYEILHMPDGGACCYLNVLPLLQRMDHTFLEMSENGYPVHAHGTGYNEGTYYYYPNTEWWNVWLYDHPYTPLRRKIINGMLQIMPRNPQMPTTITIVYNWSTPNWPGYPVLQRPPLPSDVLDPMMEQMMISRSEPIFILPPGPLLQPIMIPLSFEYPFYNPEWLSLDVRGSNFILIGDIVHTCWDEWEGGIIKEYGDAPEGDMAYIGGATGQFPTCMNVGPAGFISHGCPNPLYFGGTIDCEGEGNAGSCPMFNPNTYNMDECGTFPYPVPPPPQIDEGLMFPIPYTIAGTPGNESYVPCAENAFPLGDVCKVAYWGQNIDIWINAANTVGGLVNVLFDWNHDGVWAGSSTCPGGLLVSEHVLVNFPIPAGFVGPLSLLNPPSFNIGPEAGFVWSRFTLSEAPVPAGWDGAGNFADGETEDYLIAIGEVFDFGDAPPPYPTLLAHNGARHDNIGPNIWLGARKDFEVDGLPNPAALGDDQFNLADEDGVVLNTPLIPGNMATVTVTCNFQNAFLHAWIDFNNDGDWLDAGEQIFSNFTLNAGPNPLTFLVPPTANSGPTFARFRVNTQLGTQFFGYSPNGEVEDYHWMIEPQVPELDFGDAPDPTYPTLLANNGARHVIDGITFLGAGVDPEPNGQPDPNAWGDDNDGNDDEDGVVFLTSLVPGKTALINVYASVGGGYLNAWLDWNRNGSWAEPGEHILVEVPLVAGINPLQFNVPQQPALGNTYLRFRYSTQQGLSYNGAAQDGEVEDYIRVILTQHAIWHFDENAGNIAFDATVNNNNGNIIGATWTQGVHGSALLFNGMTDHVVVPHSLSLDITCPFSVQAWIRTSGDADYYAIVDKYRYYSDNDSRGFTFYINNGLLRLSIYAGNNGIGDVFGTSDLRDGQFHHVMASWDGSFMRCYVDGIKQGEVPWTYAPASVVQNLGIGKRLTGCGGTMEFDGIIDEVIISPDTEPVPVFDFGDAPDGPFKTLFASDGARHLVMPGIMLGNQIDAEFDGLPSALADGDDLNNLPDEDGVAFMWPVAAGNPCKLKVRASVGNALFNGWIDFNRNGSWDDPGEHVFVDLNLQAGDNYLTFIAPNAPATVPGPACARFRFSHQPALTHYGPAFDGEVEDYLVTIEEYGNIKWRQLPDPNLYGLHSDATSIIADDWICAGGTVTDIHWWGNYEMMGMIEKRGAGINHFLIHFYNNAGCLPANVIATWIVPFPNIVEQFTGMFNPEGGKIYKYEYILPEYFYQVLGNTYWISIQAIPNDINNPAVWRWHESNRWYWPINCGAATMSGMGWQTIIWDLTMPPKFSDMAFEITSQIPTEQILQNVTVPSGQIRCFAATQTIVTAGSGTTFIVQNGAVVYLIAGQNIIMLPGTHFMNGSYVHAYIDLSGEYCRNPKALVSINEEEAQSKEVPGVPWIKENFFKVYPNPTTGQFTLELIDVAEFSTIKVEIFSLVGENIFTAELPAMRQYLLDLSAKQPGIYLIRVLQGGEVGVVKLIKQ